MITPVPSLQSVPKFLGLAFKALHKLAFQAANLPTFVHVFPSIQDALPSF